MTLHRLGTLVLTVLATVPAAAQSPIPVWSLDPELRIGSVDDGPFTFGDISHITVSPRTGAVVVADYGSLRIFAPDGSHLRSFGRKGEGPGEFQRLTSVGWQGELLAAFKRSPGNVMLFTEEGALVDDRRIPVAKDLEGLEGVTGYPVAPLAQGAYLWRAAGVGASAERPFVSLVRTDGRGADRILDRLAEEPMWRAGGITGRQRLSGPSLLAAHPRGTSFVVLHQHAPRDEADAHFRLRKVDSSGQVLFARTFSYDPKPVPPAYEDSLIRFATDLIERWSSLPDVERTLRQNNIVPRLQPPATQLLLAVDGSTWIRREDVYTAVVTWLVLDPRGDPIAQLRLPTSQRILYVDGNVVWGVETDALDVQYAVRYRLRR